MPGSYFTSQPPPAAWTLSVLITCCCIINRLRVSGVTQRPFYSAHRLSVHQEFRWGVLLLHCVWGLSWADSNNGGYEGLGTGIPSGGSSLMSGAWAVRTWKRGSAGIVAWTTHMWPPWAWASHIRAVGFQEWVCGDPTFQEKQAGLGSFWPDLRSCPLSLPLHSVGYNESLRTAQIQGEGN